MKRLRVVTWQLQLAAVAAVAALTLLTGVVWRATRTYEIPLVTAGASSTNAASPISSYRVAAMSEIDRAIDLDPFHPERRRPQLRYAVRSPGENADPETGTLAPQMLELTGTVIIAGGRSFAMCQTGASQQLVHVGEKCGGYTLKKVEQNSAVFVSPTGQAVVLQVRKPGAD